MKYSQAMIHLWRSVSRKAILISACNLLFAFNSFSQDISALLLSDQQQLTKLAKTLNDNNQPQLFRKCTQVSKLLGIFSQKMGKSTTVSPDYLMALKNYNALLDRANESFDTSFIIELLQYLSTDVNLKNGSALGASEAISNAVLVKVKAVNGKGEEQNGYRVFERYYLSGDESVFDELNPTNQSEKRMLPGWYLFWIADSKGKIADRSTHIKANETNIITFLIP